MRLTRSILIPALLVLIVWSDIRAEARQANPSYVDDSPLAWELFQRAQEQKASNLTEAVRSFQELLDEYAFRLIPADIGGERPGDGFKAARARVLDVLMDPENGRLLERYRAMETPVAQRLLDAGEHKRLVTARSLTEPGLEAMLRLAQEHLEAGRFTSAVDQLTEAIVHPDMMLSHPKGAKRSAHGWFMLGLALHYLGKSPGFAADELSLLDDELARQLFAELNRIATIPASRSAARGVSSLDRTSATGLDHLVAEQIWSIELTEALASRIEVTAPPMPGRIAPAVRTAVRAREEGWMMTGSPTVAGDTVYINQGHTITALDRFTGLRVWSRDYVDRPTIMLIDRGLGGDESAMDLNVIAVEGDFLVTLTGHAQSASRSSDGRIVCLNAKSGELRWARRLDRLTPAPARDVPPPGMFEHPGFAVDEFEGLFPHGAPIIVDDLVLVEARRVSRQALTSAYIVALDLHSGEVRWIRHMVSSGSIRRAARPFSTLTAAPSDGSSIGREVFMVSPVGAVASIQPGTGEVNWLSRFSVPLNPPMAEQSRRPWELSTPAIVRDRVIAILAGQRRIAVFDRATGAVLQDFDAARRETWNSPAYLIGDDPWVYSVSGDGREVRAFHLEDLSAPVWVLDRLAPSVAGLDRIEGELLIRGRVQVARDALVVPTATALLIVDRATGDVTRHLPLDDPTTHGGAGNPVALDAQLIVAGDRTLSAYMSLEQAEQMLRERIAASPGNPEPALSLAQLALRGREFQLCLEAAEMALAALDASTPQDAAQHTNRADRRGDARSRLVSILLELDEMEVAQSQEEVEALFALLSEAARTAGQRLAHRLAYGDRLISLAEAPDHKPEAATFVSKAIATWQDVLATPDLASQSHFESEVLRPGRSWAAERIASVMSRSGRDAYAAQEDDARRRLDGMRRAGAPPAQLIALAEEFPLSRAAIDARLLAARSLRDSDEIQRALSILIGAGLELDDLGFDDGARELIAQYRTLGGELGLDGRVAAIERPDHDTFAAAPRIGFPRGTAQVLEGRLLTAPPEAQHLAPADRSLLFDGTSIISIGPKRNGDHDLTTHWSVPIAPFVDAATDGWSANIVRWTNDRLLLSLTSETRPAAPVAVMLSSRTGEEQWRALIGATPQSVNGAQRNANRIATGEFIAVADDRLLIVISQSDSTATAFDLATGSTTWQASLPAEHERVHRAHLDGGLLAVTGAMRYPAGRSGYALHVFDAARGDRLISEPLLFGERAGSGGDGDRRSALWLRLNPAGRVVYGAEGAIHSIDVWRGEHAWSNVAHEAQNVKHAALDKDRLIFEDESGALRLIDTRTGRIDDSFLAPRPGLRGDDNAAPASGSPPLGDLLSIGRIGDDFLAHYRQRIVRYGPDGAVRGADIVAEDRNFLWALPGRISAVGHTDRDARNENVLVLINALQPVQEVVQGLGGARRTQHPFRIYILSENARILGDPVELPPLPEPIREVRLIDDWLILSLSSRTIAVPMAGDESVRR